MSVNSEVVDLEDGYGMAIRDEAHRICSAFGEDPSVTLNALVFVLGLVVQRITPDHMDQVIDAIPANIRANMGASEHKIQ